MKNIFLFVLLLASHSFANNNIAFECTTKQGKIIKVSKIKNGYQYSFGSSKKNELSFSNTKKEVLDQSTPWSGFGRSITQSMTLKNNDYAYTVFSSTDRLTDEHKQTFGLTIEKNENLIIQIDCSDKHKIIFNFDKDFLL